MPSAPQQTARFNLRHDPDGMQILFDGQPILIEQLRLLAVNEPSVHNDYLVNFREAGMWFTDIARLLNYPSASSASASYVRVCRTRNIQPIVRSQRTRDSISETDLNARPDFLTRHTNSDLDFGFGVELECVGINYATAADTISQLGLACRYEGYTHEGVGNWKVVRDGSIGNGPECVSRVLHGTDGLAEMRRVQLALKQAGARVTRACGMHTHLGVEHLSRRHKALVIMTHAIFQSVFDTVCNHSRRNNGSYARHRSIHDARFLASEWNNGNNRSGGSRFVALNLDAYNKYGTFEMRAYQGCLNPQKATAWIQLNMDFLHWVGELALYSTHEVSDTFNGQLDEADFLKDMPLTRAYLRGDIREANGAVREKVPNAQNCATNSRDMRTTNFTAQDDAFKILQEWCSEGGFIKNEAVRRVLLKEAASINKFTTTNEGA